MKSKEPLAKLKETTRTASVGLAPHPSALIESLRSIGYTLETALADIIDNSVTAKAKRISVRFRWNGGDPWIAITDDGNGMASNELTEAMRFGSSSPLLLRDAKDLGRFGLGMKTASISQCRLLTVISKKCDELSAREWNLDTIAAQEQDGWQLGVISADEVERDEFLSGLLNDALRGKHSGTIVLWRKLAPSLVGERTASDEKRFSESLVAARIHLEMVFHRFLSPDRGERTTKIDFNGAGLEFFDPFGPSIPARQELPAEDITVAGDKVRVQPFVLPHHSKVSREEYNRYAGDAGYLLNQGFYVYRNKRLIVKATWFKLIKKEELNKLIRIKVDIPNTLDHLWQINVNKSQVIPPEQVRLQLRNIIGRIENAGKLVYKRRALKLQDRIITPVWKREVVDSKIRYRVNEEHPLLVHLVNNAPEPFPKQLKICLELIAEAFPYDACFADVASEDVVIGRNAPDTEEVRHVCRHLVEALRACGFNEEEIRSKALRTEIPGASADLINCILLEGKNHA